MKKPFYISTAIAYASAMAHQLLLDMLGAHQPHVDDQGLVAVHQRRTLVLIRTCSLYPEMQFLAWISLVHQHQGGRRLW